MMIRIAPGKKSWKRFKWPGWMKRISLSVFLLARLIGFSRRNSTC
jgi:hypothetical protein